MLFMAISGDSQPHFTTLAAFIANAGELIAKLFAQVLLICDRQGLIGKEMFAIDGVKLPSNASKEKSAPALTSCAKPNAWKKPPPRSSTNTNKPMPAKRMRRQPSAKPNN
jgi:Transposase and inactivated derivatives